MDDDTTVRRRPVPPRTHCPPSLRGHSWRNPDSLELLLGAPRDGHALRICKRCGKLGRVNTQGVIKEVLA